MTSNGYSRLGWLMTQRGPTGVIDSTRYDASGNIRWRKNGSDPADSFAIDDAGHHNLLNTIIHHSGDLADSVRWYRFGGRHYEATSYPTTIDGRLYYYDGLNRLAGLMSTSFGGRDGPNQCRYDAVGRLFLVCDGAWWSLDFDGQNVVRASLGSGPVAFLSHVVQGPGTDDPLVLFTRAPGHTPVNRELFFITDGQGRQYAVGDSQGVLNFTDENGSAYTAWHWAGGTQNAQSYNATRQESPNIPGLSFFRNRAYDQATEAWTQEDPLGIAGGLNLTQFNGNNPVTYSDPFGLCPKIYQDQDGNCPGQALVNAAYKSGSGFLFNLAAGANALFETLNQVMEAGPGGLVAPEGLGAGAAGGDAAAGALGLATKTAAREALGAMDLPEAQAAAVNRAIGRATTKTTIDLIRNEAGDVTVRLTRAGRNGYQTVESVVKADGSKTVIQTGTNAAGEVEHVDPKN